ncbi:MAG: NAD(+) diphosphatase [Peptococcaceae bacterium]|nr:NAD(+) diphosphatase [Peptococcaceae bacterium]
MVFLPESAPTRQVEGAAYWFAFCRDALLVCMQAGKAVVPFAAGGPAPGLAIARKIYLGRLDDHPCYAADVSHDGFVSPGLAFLGLRKLSGLLEENIYQVAGRASQLLHWDRTHQYCGRCGARTEIKADEYARCCPACGLVSYPRISPAVIGVITRGDQILLARRPGLKFYSVLAGFVEPGENLEECLRREVREEVGVEIKNINYFGSQSWPFPHSLMIAFTAEHAGGEINVDGVETVDAGWYTVDNLPALPDPVSIAWRLVNWFVERFR